MAGFSDVFCHLNGEYCSCMWLIYLQRKSNLLGIDSYTPGSIIAKNYTWY